MNTNKEKITTFMEKILPFMRNPKNSEDTLKIYLGYELEKFYNHAFVDGQLDVLKQKGC